MTKEEMIKWINCASYHQLLEHWRFAKAGDPFFIGEVGKYYSEVMGEKRAEKPDEAVRVSKDIGWGDA